MKTTAKGKALAPVVDIFPQLCVSPHDDKRIDEEMRLLKELGFERVYFVLCNPGYPMFSSPNLSIQIPGQKTENYSWQSIKSLGDPNFAYLYHCHKYGMEAFAIIKPYECGGGATVPHNAVLSLDEYREKDIGGDRIGFDALLTEQPQLRVKRKPIKDYEKLVSQPITGMKASFCLDALPEVNYSGNNIEDIEKQLAQFSFFSSSDNCHYTKVQDYKISGKIETIPFVDFNGVPVGKDPVRCFTVEITELNLKQETEYCALLVQNGKKLYTIPQAMLKIYGPAGEIPSTLGMSIRQDGNPNASTEKEAKKGMERIWGLETHPLFYVEADIAEKALDGWGFEFEWQGAGHGSFWRNSAIYGLAKGKYKYMKGTPCEACPEVQSYWLQFVDKVQKIGFDGIDIRLQYHSGMISDYFNYGFNDEIVVKYKERYGVDILAETPDPLKIMEIRGDFFTDFLQKTAELLHENGRKLQVHLRNCHEKPVLTHHFNELGFWAMPKIWLKQWKKIIDFSDEITIKDYYFNHYNSAKCSEIKTYAKSQKKRVWVHCYLSQGRELNHPFFASVEEDPNIGGILLYETAHSFKTEVNLGLIEQYGPVGLYKPAAEELETLKRDFKYQ